MNTATSRKAKNSNPYLTTSITFSYLQLHFTSAKPSRVRNQSLGSIYTSEQRPATVTTSVVLSIKTYRIGLMLVEKQTSLSTKPKPIAGRICCTSPCQILMVQMFGRLFEVSTAPQIPTHPMRPCRITALNHR